jgi:amidohydrolase
VTLSELAAGWSARLEHELPAATDLRHELHAHPEVSGQETWTAQRVAGALDAADAPAVAGTGRLVRIGADGRPAIAVRAELDGLPMRERSDAPYAAEGEAMHACGHDVHLAALVALARSAPDDLPAALLAVVQPREELSPSGAEDVVASGVLAAHDVRAVIGAHVQPRLPDGAVSAEGGVVNASVDEFELHVTGRGGHGAYPHLAGDTVSALSACVLAAQAQARAAVDPMHVATLSFGVLRAGSAANVIPAHATATGTLRAFGDDDRERMLTRLRHAARTVADTYGCQGELQVLSSEPALYNDPGLAERAAGWLGSLGPVQPVSFRSCGSDDFAYYAAAAPSLMLFVGCGEAREASPMLHQPTFVPDDALIGQVARAMLAGWLAAAEALPAR